MSQNNPTCNNRLVNTGFFLQPSDSKPKKQPKDKQPILKQGMSQLKKKQTVKEIAYSQHNNVSYGQYNNNNNSGGIAAGSQNSQAAAISAQLKYDAQKNIRFSQITALYSFFPNIVLLGQTNSYEDHRVPMMLSRAGQPLFVNVKVPFQFPQMPPTITIMHRVTHDKISTDGHY